MSSQPNHNEPEITDEPRAADGISESDEADIDSSDDAVPSPITQPVDDQVTFETWTPPRGKVATAVAAVILIGVIAFLIAGIVLVILQSL